MEPLERLARQEPLFFVFTLGLVFVGAGFAIAALFSLLAVWEFAGSGLALAAGGAVISSVAVLLGRRPSKLPPEAATKATHRR